MSSSQEGKAREEFIARCSELKIKAKEKENKPLSLLPNGMAPKHPGHYRAPAFSSFERQFGSMAEKKPTLLSSNQHKPSETPKSSGSAPNFSLLTPNTSKLSAVARKQAIGQCHQELAACYEKLAALHILEAEDALDNKEPS